jgi:hypothetical protein
MSPSQVVIPVLMMVGGAVVLMHRRLRVSIAKGIVDWHAEPARRFPWLYGPRPLREWMLSVEGCQQFIAVWAGALVVLSIVGLLAAFLD